MTLELSRDEARAIAVRAAWLADARPDGLIDMVRRLGALRIELPVLHHDRLGLEVLRARG